MTRTKCNIGMYAFDAEGDDAVVTRLFDYWRAYVEERLRAENERAIRHHREQIRAHQRAIAMLTSHPTRQGRG